MNAYLILLAFQSATVNLDLPPGLLYAICYTETKGEIDPPHVIDGTSPSYGICQVKMGTARGLDYKGTAKQLINPQVNIYQAGKILKYHLDRCATTDEAIMAYNTGSCKKHSKPYLARVTKNVR